MRCFDSVRSAGPESPPAAPDPTLRRLIQLARAQLHHKVCVCGPEGLETLLALHRLGYSEAACVSSHTCRCGEAPCDVLLLTGYVGPAGLAAALTGALPRLRDGGVLAVHESGLQDDALILQVLAASGRAPGWRVHDMAAGCLLALQVVCASAEDLQRAA